MTWRSAPDAHSVHALLAAHLPGERIERVTRLGAGLDNDAFDVDDRLVVRFSRDGAAAVEHEGELLAFLAERVPVAVPTPLLVLPEAGCLVYPKLRGISLFDVPPPRRVRIARRLAPVLDGLLGVLRDVPLDRLGGLLPCDDTPASEWLDEAKESFPAIVDAIPARHRPAIEAFLAAAPPAPASERTLVHNDLGAEHILVELDPPANVAVIDWSDAAIGDPAVDLGRLLRDLGPDVLARVMGRNRSGVDGLEERAWFYARCTALEDIAFGCETGRREYVTNALAAVPVLFP